MYEMFMDSKFNGDLSKWDISGIRDLKWMFEDCEAPVPWWYIEDNKERKDAVEKWKEKTTFKEKIEAGIQRNVNGKRTLLKI